MRAVIGIVGLLAVLAIVAVVAKKQLATVHTVPSGAAMPAVGESRVATPQQLPEHVRQTIEATLQQARPMPEDK